MMNVTILGFLQTIANYRITIKGIYLLPSELFSIYDVVLKPQYHGIVEDGRNI